MSDALRVHGPSSDPRRTRQGSRLAHFCSLPLCMLVACANPTWTAKVQPLPPPDETARPPLILDRSKGDVDSPLVKDHGNPPRLTSPPNSNPRDLAPLDRADGRADSATAQDPWRQVASRPARTAAPVGLADVLESVRRRFPPMLAAMLEEDIASGRLLSAQGGFDFNITAKTTLDALGFYRYSDTGVILEQPTTLGGLSLLGGYKLSTGTLPVYDGDKKTNDAGEVNAGFRLPLLQGSAIDRRRATLSQAQIDQELADPIILRQRLDFLRIAARAYWNWVAAGRRLEIAEDLLRIALERDGAIARRVETGDLPGIDRVDNERLVVQRRTFVVAAERRFEQSSIELSLYYRDGNDRPVILKRDALPDGFPGYTPPDLLTLEVDVQNAYGVRPELRRLQLQANRTGVDLELAENQILPNLDVSVLATQPLSDAPSSDKKDFNVKAGFEFKLPVQRRDALGRVDAAKAQLQRIAYEAQFARDRIRAEITDAMSAKSAAYRQIAEFRRNLELARRLEAAERRSFDLGRSNLIFVNLREQATADAAALEVDALAEYLRTLADYAIACGLQGAVEGL